MDNVIAVFSNPIVIVVICVAFGFPILMAILRMIRKKLMEKEAAKQNSKSAQHVRDAVRKYDAKNTKK